MDWNRQPEIYKPGERHGAMMRILLKLSGEALAGSKKTGFDEETVRGVALQVKDLAESTQVGIVIGGGNFWRGRSSENIDRTKADQIGMLATVMNCIYVSEIFRSVGMETEILTPFSCGSFTKMFSKDKANKYFGQGKVVFFAGGNRTSLFFYGHRGSAPCGRGGSRCDIAGKSGGRGI